MKQLCKATAVLGAALVAAPAFCYGQDEDLGKRVYVSRCAVCHGVSGKGDGPLAAQLKAHVANLTQIQKTMGAYFLLTDFTGSLMVGKWWRLTDRAKCLYGEMRMRSI